MDAVGRWLTAWDIDLVGVTRLRGGEVKESWVITTADGRRQVLRRYPAAAQPAHVEQELAWLAALAEDLPEIPRPVATRDGALSADLGGRPGVLTAFVDGTRPERGSLADRAANAAFLARLHVAAAERHLSGLGGFEPVAGTDWRSNAFWALDVLERTHRGHPLLERAHAGLALLPEVLAVLASLPHVLIHNDFHAGNVLMAGGAVAAVVDWDWACVDARMLDVAAGVRSFASGDAEADVAVADAFLDEYGLATSAERDALGAALWARELWAVLWDLGRHARGEATDEDLAFRLSMAPWSDALVAGLGFGS